MRSLLSGETQCDDCEIFLVNDSPGGDHNPCPSCGSKKRRHHMKLRDQVVFCDQIGMKARHAGATGKRKYHWMLKDGHKFSRDGSGRLVYEFQLFDRENDYYAEVVINARTDEIIKCESGPLSNHIGHGSAKFGARPRTEVVRSVAIETSEFQIELMGWGRRRRTILVEGDYQRQRRP